MFFTKRKNAPFLQYDDLTGAQNFNRRTVEEPASIIQ